MGIPGTGSTAVQNPDGTWNILDVEIVHEGEIPRYNAAGAHVDDFPVTTAWMRKVIGVHAQRETEGYMGRAFIDHHSLAEGSQPDAGFIRPKRIGMVTVHGSSKAALFADLISVQDDVYQEWIAKGRVPYRSIESLVAERGFIDGLALMPTRSPHFELSMLTIGDEVVPDGTSPAPVPSERLVACASSARASVIFNQESSMATILTGSKNGKAINVEVDAETLRALLKTPDAVKAALAAAKTERRAKAMKPEDEKDEEDKDETPVAKGEGESESEESESSESTESSDSGGWSAKFEALKAVKIAAEDIPEFIAALREMADALEPDGAGVDEGMDEIEEIDPTPIAEQEEQLPAGMTASKRIANAESMAAAANVTANALRDKITMGEAVSDAVDSLSEYNLGSDPKGTLAAFASKNGLKALALHVETIKAHAMPSPGLEGMGKGSGRTQEDMADLPEEVLHFTNPSDRAVAIQAHRSFQEQAALGFTMGTRNLKRTVARAVERARTTR